MLLDNDIHNTSLQQYNDHQQSTQPSTGSQLYETYNTPEHYNKGYITLPQFYTMASNEAANTNPKRPGLPHRPTSNLRFEAETPDTPSTPTERPGLFRRISSFRNDTGTPPSTPKRPTLEHRSSSFKKAVGGVKGFFTKDAASVITIEGMSEYLGSMTPPASVPGTPISVAEDQGGYFDLSTVNKALEELQSTK
ncbi:hypothetical protein LTR42_007530 [Elasticomyces elasticus]|nr:hypothetical protein LTR42_007530 [Elasticomyces elasticus]